MRQKSFFWALLLPVSAFAAACSDDSSSGPQGQAGSSQAGAAGAGAGGKAAGAGGASAGQGGASAGAGGSAAGAGGAAAGAGGSAAGSGGAAAGAGGSAAGAGGSAAGAGGAGRARAAAMPARAARGGGRGRRGRWRGGQAGSLKNGFITFGTSFITVVPGLPTPIFSNTASASFTDSTPGSGNPAPACKVEEVDGCQAISCDLGAAGSSGAGGPPQLSAGDVTITGGVVSPVTLKLKDIPNTTTKAYQADPALPTDKAVLLGGEALEAKAPGADAPAFSLKVTAPSPLTVEGFPVVAPGASFELDTSKDFSLKFSGGGEGTVQLYVSAASDSQSLALLCVGPANGGGLAVKSSLLQKLKAVGAKGTLLASQNNSAKATVGDWSLTFAASNILQGADGKPLTPYAQTTIK